MTRLSLVRAKSETCSRLRQVGGFLGRTDATERSIAMRKPTEALDNVPMPSSIIQIILERFTFIRWGDAAQGLEQCHRTPLQCAVLGMFQWKVGKRAVQHGEFLILITVYA